MDAFTAYYDSIRDRAKDPELCRMFWDAGRAALEAELREQEPVAAQYRFRHPQKTMPDWAPWQPCRVDMRRENWSIDSMGYEVEYRNLYAAPQPPAPVAVPEGWQLVPKMATARMLGAIDVIDRSVGMYGTDRDALMGERQANYRAMLASAPQPPAPTVDVEAVDDTEAAREGELNEIADGAWGDGPAVRGAARDKLARAIGDET